MLWLIIIEASAQIVRVTDYVTKEPIEMVSVYQLPLQTRTDMNGEADISLFEGKDSIVFRLLGYKTIILSFEELKKKGFKVQLKSTAFSLDGVVVSSSRWEQLSRESPSKITSLSPRDAALQNPQTTADLLATSGEVFIQKSQQGGGSPIIRGFSTNRLLITVDGVRMNNAIFRGGNVQQVISLDPFSIENTEIFFGPGSVMYGSDAIGGVMSFQTLRPRLSMTDNPFVKGNAVLRHASANKELAGHFDVNVGGKKWAMLTSISSHQYNNLRMGRFGPDEYQRPFYVNRIDNEDVLVQNPDPLVQNPSGYTQQNIMQKVLYKPNENWEINYGFHYSATSDYDRYDRHIRYDNAGMPRSAEWKYGPQAWMMNNLTLTHHKKTKLYDQMNLQVSHQLFEESRIDRNFNSNRRRIREEKVNAYAANLDFVKKISSSRKLYYGAEAVINEVNSIGTDEHIITKELEQVGSRYPNSTWSSYGIYATYHQNLSEKLSFQAGARYNQFMIDAVFDTNFYPIPFTEAKINNGALTGSLGFIYSPDKTWAIRINASSGFRSPNIDDMGKVFDIEPGAVVVPNPNLTAEYAYNGELGVAKLIGEYLKIDLTGYYTILDNAMVRRDYQLNGLDSIMYDGNLNKVQAIQNAAQAYVMGIQANIEVRLPSGFGVSSKVNFQKGQEEMNDGSLSPSRHVTPWFGVTRLTYSVSKLRLDFYAMYSGGVTHNRLNIEERGKPEIYATDGNGKPFSPGWYTLNFKALYRVNEHFQLSSGMENLTDQRYRPYSSGLVAPGRNFILALKMMF